MPSITIEIEDPSIYKITLNSEQLKSINDLIQNDLSLNPDKTIHKRKDPQTCEQIPYTVLKTPMNNYFLMGWGQRNQNRNAFFGRGGNCRSVKGAVLLKKEDKYIISNEIYAVKIVEKPQNIIVEHKLLHEVEIYKEVYGYAELIEHNNKYYLIMPKMPGIVMNKLDYNHMEIEELINLLYSIFDALSKLHAKGIFHQDFKIDNMIYDRKTTITYLIDFEFSQKEPKLNFRHDLSDSLQAAKDIINEYAKAHSIMQELSERVQVNMRQVINQLFCFPERKMKELDNPIYRKLPALIEDALAPLYNLNQIQIIPKF